VIFTLTMKGYVKNLGVFIVIFMIYCFCSLVVVPHRFLQVRRNYIRCIPWYFSCVIVFPIKVTSELLVYSYIDLLK